MECSAAICPEEVNAKSVAPANIRSAPPITLTQRSRPASRNSLKSANPQKIPNRLFMFQRGKAILSPISRIAKMVIVFATAQRHPAKTPQTIKCGASRTSKRICPVPRIKAGRLQRARNTPITMRSETTMGDTPACTNFVGASAAPNQAPAPNPQRTPNVCKLLRREASSD